MEEIARFLARHAPFDQLPAPLLAQTAATVEIEYFARGTRILRQDSAPSRYLHLIVKGTVELRQAAGGDAWELVETLAAGETFGQLSLLSHTPHLWDAVAREDVLAYLIPAAQVERLRHQPGFEALLARRAGDRLRHALAASRLAAPLGLLQVQAGELVTRPLVTCAPAETVTEAARRMRSQRVSSLIVEGEPPGLVTATDLRNRVLAAGLAPDTPVREVMTMSLRTMPADTSLGELLLAMVDGGVHHLPLTREGRLVGMVTDSDLLRQESRHPLFVRRQLERAGGPDELAAYGRGHGGRGRPGPGRHPGRRRHPVRPAPTTPCTSGPSATPRRSWARRPARTRCCARQRRPPRAPSAPTRTTPWPWPTTRHRGRRLVRGHGRTAGRDPGGLRPARCPGNIMATNPARRVTLPWQDQFARWIGQPEEDALLEAAILFDFRQLHGDLDAEAPLRRVIRRAAGTGGSSAAWPRRRCRRPPLRFLRHLPASAGSTSRRTASPRSSTSAGCSPWRRAARRRPPSAASGRRPATAPPARPPPTWSPPSSTSRRSACATRPACSPPAGGWTTASTRTSSPPSSAAGSRTPSTCCAPARTASGSPTGRT